MYVRRLKPISSRPVLIFGHRGDPPAHLISEKTHQTSD